MNYDGSVQEAFYSGVFFGTSEATTLDVRIGFVTNMNGNRQNGFLYEYNTIQIDGNEAATSGTLSCESCEGQYIEYDE